MKPTLIAIGCLALIAGACASDSHNPAAPEGGTTMYDRWQHGPPTGTDYFPIAVWLQDPANAARYRDAGINLYVGLWDGPTESQLSALAAAGMQVICDQNSVGLRHLADPVIVGWMRGDEPDNAQALPDNKGWGPPIVPDTVVAQYQRIKAADPSRPTLLNLGQGVAWDEYVGRGVRTGHPEDYPAYARAADIVSFDIYPAASEYPQIAANLWYVARGVQRLRQWAAADQPVWNCIEVGRIYAADRQATPKQVRAEVWMSLIHGSTGLVYFVHEWYPKFNEHALLDDPAMLAEVTAINSQIHALAPVLNSPTVADGATVTPADASVPLAAMTKQYDGATYIFVVSLRGTATAATVALTGSRHTTAEVLGENRGVSVQQGAFSDTFEPWGVHLYCLR